MFTLPESEVDVLKRTLTREFKPALIHYFAALGRVDPDASKTVIQNMIYDKISELSRGHDDQIGAEIAERETIESRVHICQQPLDLSLTLDEKD